MEKERKITASDGCEIEKVELIDGVAVVTFKEKERKPEILHFRTEKLRDEFLRNFRDLIEKIKPLYGIKEGGEKC